MSHNLTSIIQSQKPPDLGLHNTQRKIINPCYISLIVLTVISVLMILIGCILIGCYIHIPIGIAIICLSVSLISFILFYIKRVDRYKSSPVIPEPKIFPVISKQDLHIKHIFKKPQLSIFEQSNDSIDFIEKYKFMIMTNTCLPEDKHHSLSRIPLDTYTLLLDIHNDNRYIYKLNYASRNTHYIENKTKVYERCQANIIARDICTQYNLDTLIAPEMHYKSLPFNEHISKLSYDLSIEERLPFKIDKSEQENLYKPFSEDLKKIVQQLTTFICATGCSSIDFNHNPINPHSANQVYLLDLDIDLTVTDTRIEDGLFGTKSKRGLINCLGSEELIDLMLETASSMGVDITSERAQDALNNRKIYFQIQNELEVIYESKPTHKEDLKILDLNLDNQIIKNSTLQIPEKAIQLIKENINQLINPPLIKSPNTETLLFKQQRFHHSIFSLSEDPTINYHFYRDTSDIPNKSLNIYNTSCLINQIIKQEDLNLLVVPEMKLLSIEHNGETYHLLAVENLNLLTSYNKTTLECDSKAAIMQLIKLNSILGLDIKDNNVFRLDDSIYKLVLMHNLPGKSSMNGLIGSNVYEQGILSLAKSELMMKEILLEGAKNIVLAKDTCTFKQIRQLNWINAYLRIQEFYSNNNITIDQTIDISPEDLAPYLDLDLVISLNDKKNGTTGIPMRDAIMEIIIELNQILNDALKNHMFKNEVIASKRELRIDYIKNKVISKYKRISVAFLNSDSTDNESIDQVNEHSYPLSCFDLIREALTANGNILPSQVDYDSKFDLSTIFLYV